MAPQRRRRGRLACPEAGGVVTTPAAYARVVGALLAPKTVPCTGCGAVRGAGCTSGAGFCGARKAAVAGLSTAQRVDAYAELLFESQRQVVAS